MTPAGTVIDNAVTLTYSTEGVPGSTTSNTASFTVDELINVVIIWQDAAPVAVNSPDLNDVLTFLLTNTGNGTETFSLSRNNAPSVTDNYDPISSAAPLYVESNGTPGLQTGPGGDTEYTSGITLDAEASVIVYVLSNTPAAQVNNNTGQVALTAAATTDGASGAVAGTILSGKGDGGIDAIVGTTRAQSTANGIHIVSGLSVGIAKTVEVVGGGDAAPGKTLAYTLTITLTGTGTAAELTVSDPLPAELTYSPGTIKVDSASRTDAADSDNTQFSSGTLTVSFGDTAAPASHAITFSAVIN